MSEQPENIILIFLRRLDIFLRRLDQKVDRLIDDVSDLKPRVSAVVAAVARVDPPGSARASFRRAGATAGFLRGVSQELDGRT